MSAFDVILFDIGGVLLTNGWDRVGRANVLKKFGLDKAQFDERHPEANDEWERDLIDVYEYMQRTVFYEPRAFTPEDFKQAIFAESYPLADPATPILAEVAAKGRWLVGSLNNEAREPHEHRMQKYDLGKYFEIQMCSAYVGLRKPYAPIYKRALDLLSRPGDRILFIDDREGNVTAAREAGITTLHYTGTAALREDLNKLGVL